MSSIAPSTTPPISMDYLPDVVLIIIFQKLSIREKARVELVANRWKDLSRISWKYLTQIDFGLVIGQRFDLKAENLVLQLLDRMRGGPNGVTALRRVKFGEFPLHSLASRLQAPSPRVFQAICDLCPHLVKVETYHQISKMWLPLSECVNVEEFTFSNGSHEVEEIEEIEEVLSALVQKWRRLRHLKCSCCSNLRGNFLCHVSSSLISLKIRILGTNNENIMRVRSFGTTNENIMRVISNCPRLEILTLEPVLAMADLLPVRHLIFLKHLDICLADRNMPGVVSMFHEKPNLVHLDLRMYPYCDEPGRGPIYFQVLSLLPALRHFGIIPGVDTYRDFVQKWFDSDAEFVGLRRKDAPLNLRLAGHAYRLLCLLCKETGIPKTVELEYI